MNGLKMVLVGKKKAMGLFFIFATVFGQDFLDFDSTSHHVWHI
jgi:hypothetical protein